MTKRTLVLSMCIVWSALWAGGNIVIKDDRSRTRVGHKNIIGCEETPTSKKQREDIKRIRRDLSKILAKLSRMEKEVDSQNVVKKKSRSKVKRSLWKRSRHVQNKPKTYVTVKVKAGDSLSSYARKYYGDKRKYYRIYRANRDKIGADLKLKIGDKIIIPINKNYKYKRYGKSRKANRIEIRDRITKKAEEPKMVKEKVEIVYTPTAITVFTPTPTLNYSMEKTKKEKNKDIEILDKPVYIDDNGLDSSDFISLDDS